jgi:peroxiredoxin
VKKPSFTILLLLFLLWKIPVIHAESVASYKELRDQMLKKRADTDKKKGSGFTAAERKLMKDSLAQAQKDSPSPGLKPGQKAPDFTLNNAFGKPVSLSAQLKNGPVVLVFYRGAWCPFCNLHLHVLQKNIDNFKKYGATLIAVTPQQPDQSVKQINKKGYPFEVLSDLDDSVMKQYGLYYKLSADLVSLYKRKGLDVEQYNGKGRVALPIPGTFVIGQDSIIKAAHAEHDYKERMEPGEIIQALQQ